MDSLITYLEARSTLSQSNLALLREHFVIEEVPARAVIHEAGAIARHVYFLEQGIVKGYQNIEGKVVVQHLIAEQHFFSAIDSFMSLTPSTDCFEAITACQLYKGSAAGFEALQSASGYWGSLAQEITNEHLMCKQARVRDFQTLTAKERYLKFIAQEPALALQAPVETIASYLGMEPQSLSRIRKQLSI